MLRSLSFYIFLSVICFGQGVSVQAASGTLAVEDKEQSIDTANCIPRAALNAYVDRSIARKAANHKAFPGPKNGIVLLGSSIVEEGSWLELLPGHPVINRGIGADTTDGVMRRLQDIIAMSPRQVVLYIGGNDFSRQGRSVEEASSGLKNIVDGLLSALPKTEIVLMTLFPRELTHAEKILGYNSFVKEMSSDRVTVLDMFSDFAREDGSINPEFTNDGIHLMPDAYKMWAQKLAPLLITNSQ